MYYVQVLTEILRRFQEAGLTLSQENYRPCRSKMTYFGFVLDKYGLHVDLAKGDHSDPKFEEC